MSPASSASSSTSDVCGNGDGREDVFNGEEGVDLEESMLECTPTVERAVILRTGDPSSSVLLVLWVSHEAVDLVGGAFLV
jgi:hypothetical protein